VIFALRPALINKTHGPRKSAGASFYGGRVHNQSLSDLFGALRQ